MYFRLNLLLSMCLFYFGFISFSSSPVESNVCVLFTWSEKSSGLLFGFFLLLPLYCYVSFFVLVSVNRVRSFYFPLLGAQVSNLQVLPLNAVRHVSTSSHFIKREKICKMRMSSATRASQN